MRRFVTTVALGAVLAAGAWALWHREQISSVEDALRLASRQFGGLLPASQAAEGSGVPAIQSSWMASGAGRGQILVATFNIRAFGQKKASDPVVLPQLATICSQFDILAIQEVRNLDQSAVVRLVDSLRQMTGRSWSFVISSPQGRSDHYREQAAFVFDEARVRLDGATSYTVQDPDGLLVRPPFVGWFRAVSPRPESSFTFSLVNVHLNPEEPARELAFLRQLFRSVRNDGRGEDDVIILGDFNAGDRLLQASAGDSRLAWVIRNEATNTRGTSQYDNIVFDPLATTEFTGQGGVFDFLKHLNLTLDQALDISDHLPVWAGFSLLEGGGSSVTGREASADSQFRPDSGRNSWQ